MSLKNFVNQQLFFRLGEFMVGTKTLKYLPQIELMLHWPKTEIVNWQEKKLRILINYAYNNTLYYKQLFDNMGLKPDDIQTIADLNKLPKLTKEIIRENKENLIPKEILGKYKRASSGGSSGDPLQFLVSHDCWSFQNAFQMHEWQRMGFKLGDNHIALGSSSLFPVKSRSYKHEIYYFLKGKIPVNGIAFSDEDYNSLVELIRKKKIKFIYGYASAIYLFSLYLYENAIKLEHIAGVITTSEILLKEYYQTIKLAFGVPILDAYGAADGGISAYKMDEELYRVSYNSLVQVDNINNHNQGPILVTDLLNYAFPFIRYELGDEVEISDDVDNTYNGQSLNKVLGRIPEVIRLANGRVLTGPGFTILFKDMNISAYRIASPNERSIVCEIVKSENFSVSEEKLIIETLKHQVGEGVIVELKYKEKFELLPSGKRNYFILNHE